MLRSALWLLLVLGVVSGPSASAEDLGLTVRFAERNQLRLVLTHTGKARCRVATTTLGTVSITRLEQDGRVIEPIPFEVSLDEDFTSSLLSRLTELAPGQSLELRLPVVPLGPTGHAIETVAGGLRGAPVGLLHPFTPGAPLKLSLTYAVPIPTPDEGSPLCAAASTTVDVQPARASSPWVLGLGLVLAVAVAVVLALLLRKKRRGSVAVLFLGAGLLALPREASARFTVGNPLDYPESNAELQAAWDQCIAIFRAPGGDPANLLPTLDAPDVDVRIWHGHGDVPHEGREPTTGLITITWDPTRSHTYYGTGGPSDPCSTLYHEMHHAWADARGGVDDSECVTSRGRSGLSVREVEATRAQNLLRAHLGLPPRSHYGRTPLPKGECLPPDRQPHRPGCTTRGCGDSNGEPHLMTFDGLRYDFQAVGEFIAARDTEGGFEVQVRQGPYPGSRAVAVNTAVAFDTGGARVTVRLVNGQLALRVDGTEVPFQPATLPNGARLEAGMSGLVQVLTVHWQDGSVARVAPIGTAGLHLSVQPSEERAGRLEGLLGDFNGDSSDDVRPRGGAPLAKPGFKDLYPGFADSWRVTQQSSLFDYGPGESTATFTDRSMPEYDATERIPNRDAAEALCRRRGVTEAGALAACTLDFALTGQPDFIEAALATQEFLASRMPGKPTRREAGGGTARTGEPLRLEGTLRDTTQRDRYTVEAGPGQGLFLTPGPTCPKESRITVAVRDGKGGPLAAGRACQPLGRVEVRGPVTVEVGGGGTGPYALTVVGLPPDDVMELSFDGEATGAIEVPGAQDVHRISARAGDIAYLAARCTGEARGLVFELREPGGTLRQSGEPCRTLGRVVFDKAGTWTLTVAGRPRTELTGAYRMHLARVRPDNVRDLSVDTEVSGRIDQPGAHDVFRLTASPSLRLAPGAECRAGVLSFELRDPAGALAVTGDPCAPRSLRMEKTGTWTLTVAGRDKPPGTGSYGFRLVRP